MFLQTNAKVKVPFFFTIPADPEKCRDAESISLHGKMLIMKEVTKDNRVNLSS